MHRIGQDAAQMYQFLFQQETGNCGLQIFCDANDGGMRPVGGAKASLT